MLILALESSAKPASVAVYNSAEGFDKIATKEPPVPLPDGGKLLGQYFQNNGFSHSRTLLAMAQSLMSNLDIKPCDIDLIAVAHGPGSFTGVRIGVSAAKGLAWGLDIPVCGVSTLEAMAYQTPEPGAIICPVMDARREQVYNALFEWRDNSLIRLCDDRAISLEDLALDLQRYSDMPYRLVGDGVAVACDYLMCQENCSTGSLPDTPENCPADTLENRPVDSQDNRPPDTPELLHYQTAYGVALAALHTEPIPAASLEPRYLRPSQAERAAGG